MAVSSCLKILVYYKGLISSIQSIGCLPNICGAWSVGLTNSDFTRQIINMLLTFPAQSVVSKILFICKNT